MYAMLTPAVAAEQIEDRRRQAAALRQARAYRRGVRRFRKPDSERVSQPGEGGQVLTSAPCVNCG